MRHPLLSSILLVLTGCVTREEDVACLSVEPDADSCPAAADVTPDELSSLADCDNRIKQVVGEGELTSGWDTGTVLCCYEVVSVDSTPGSECAVGRPYLEDGEARRAPLARRRDWGAGPGDPVGESAREGLGANAAELAGAWARMAAMEHASVASFSRVVLSLLALGAPAELVTAVLDAGQDEVRHARMCFGAASRLGGAATGPGALALGPVVPETDLAGLAVSTLREGCLGETLGALLAEEAAGSTTDPALAATLRVIAADEARHAVLSWRIVAWALGRGGAPVHAALVAALREPVRVAPAIAADGGEVWGCLGPARTTAVADRAWREVVAPALAQLLGARVA